MSVYKTYDSDQLEELSSNFLIESWSYSKVSEFARNEKAFEMSSIYGYRSKHSSSTVAGNAYHEALDQYFEALKTGEVLDIVALQMIAYEYIESVNANRWKLQKTTPTISECKLKAVKSANQLLSNFVKECDVYLSDIKKVLHVELYIDEFVTLNGVDIPLPLHAKIDLVVLTNEGKIAVIDHKSKTSFTDLEELELIIGRQAISYVVGFESKFNKKVDEVWFVENKISENRDKSAQLSRFVVQMDSETRRLYESLLYEPLKRMISAVGDPDYVYLINDQDNFIDKSEIYAFWAKTMIAEVDEFNIPENKREMIAKRMKKIRDASVTGITPKVFKQFREKASTFIKYDLSDKDMTQKEKIEHTLRSFGLITNVAHVLDGFSSDTYLLEISAGIRIGSIQNHKLDIANALNVSSVRISKDLIVYQGKSYLAIESSKKRDRDLLFDKKYQQGMKIPIGINNYNEVVHWDLLNHSTPHVLMCGATGSGKSVCIRSSIEFAKLAGVTDIVILDPKYEFMRYKQLGAQVYNEIQEIEDAMRLLVKDMNSRVKSGVSKWTLVIFDEFADAVAASKKGAALNVYEDKQVGQTAKGMPVIKRVHTDTLLSLEENMRVLLQKGRSSGYRVLAATQRASVKVITGDAKVNFPVQVCFRVPKAVDSKVVLDEEGAEALAGYGDGLIKSPEYPDTVRFQAFYTN
jgi:DNA segregation ATPase FtsK/SpoIIIE, S-DNA-T family